MNQPTDEFVEIPRWIRVLNDRLWFGGPRLSRRDLLVIEALNMGFAAIGFAVSFLAPLGAKAAIVRMGAVVSLLCGYLVAVSIRMSDKYKLWPDSRNASPEMPRTWRSVTAEYTLFIVLSILGIVMAAWLFVGF